jgi:HTH-type transcriptional regulator/antitoxin HigA
MNAIKPIRTESDYNAALARIETLMDAQPGTPKGEELDLLADLVEHYESRHVALGYPSAVAALEFRMEQAGLTRRDLVPFIGSRAKVSEVLSGKRQLTMPMARALHEHLGIPADVLLRRCAPSLEAFHSIDSSLFPVKAMIRLGWFVPNKDDLRTSANRFLSDLLRRAGGPGVGEAVLYRKTDRTNAKTDPYALKAWCWKVLATANEARAGVRYQSGTITPDLLRELARLSSSQDGPRRAQQFLGEHGVPLVVVPHLPRTYLDGAALKLADGTPVVGLTLRYDRLDNFWFCLFHELSHVGRHMDADGDAGFLDDLTLRDAARRDPKESEADEWAEDALIPRGAWENSLARRSPSPTAVINLANAVGVHPAIVAGRVRKERDNYRLLSQFVGSGEVRHHFASLTQPT